MEDEPAVDVRGLSRRYGRRWALVDVSFSVPPGSVVMVAGRNGSGKTTLLRVLATAIRADHGSARVAGFDIRTSTQEVRQRTALLSHQSHLYEALTALENLQVAARFLGRDAGRGALGEVLAQVDLAHRADDPLSTFSAGMRKRLSLARTLLQRASVVFLDEPYAQLDPPGFHLVDGLLRGWRQEGVTVLMATHLVDRGRAHSDMAVHLEGGRLRFAGPAGDLPAGDLFDESALADVR
jgi:heme exporter protein A